MHTLKSDDPVLIFRGSIFSGGDLRPESVSRLASFLAEVISMQLQDKSPGSLEEQGMVKLLIQCKGIPELPEELEGWKVGVWQQGRRLLHL
jgi:hypothetical protein